MKAWKVVGAGAIGLAIASRIMAREAEPVASMHEHDWEAGAVPRGGRRYRSLAQLLHHLRELALLIDPITRVYILRAIDPAFREQIMVVTAAADGCPP